MRERTAMIEESKRPSGPSSPFFTKSWTDILSKTQHADRFRETDYGPTLGQISEWGPALRFYTTMAFADSRPACIYWGPEQVAIYNDASVETMGGPEAKRLGKPFKETFPEIWNDIKPIFKNAAATAKTADVGNILLFPIRHGFIEETYFVGQFIPLRGDSGQIEGFYNTIFESTTQVLYERRRKVLESIAAIPLCSVDDTLSQVIEVLQGNPHDIPMAMLYSLDEGATAGSGKVRLRGSIGLPDGLPCAPSIAELGVDDFGILPCFRQAMITSAPVVLSQSDGSLQATGHLFNGVEWAGYGEASRDIVIFPLSSGGKMLGFYVQGTNPRRPYDDVAQMSIADMARHIEAKWGSSVSAEEAKVREELLERRLTDSARRLREMAQSAPIGMCQIIPEHGGTIEWANDQFYEITGHTKTKPAIADFLNAIAPEDRERATGDLGSLFERKTRVVSELRLTRRWAPPVQEDHDAVDDTAWILTIGFPVFDETGKPKVLGYLYDISHQKWAESVQMRNATAATLAKRRQEEFIDITSHEMRNPLTAIVQLADGISKSLHDTEGSVSTSREIYQAVAQGNVESADTILACAAHLQRVIDDVLMLSRLESHMLAITPVVAQPDKVVANTVKMFDGEIALHGTKIEVVRDGSYESMHVGHVLCDPSRLAQVLINLISNAIKFTATQPERRISVVYGAQQRRPPLIQTVFGKLTWMAVRQEQRENTVLPDLPNGEVPLYLYFCVQDTGPGVKPDELDRLFKRFSQANSRTHISYGGSGLGLYICRELAEKQGGGVGITSRPDEGSVFGFYIETRRAEDAKKPHDASYNAPILLATSTSNSRPDLPQRLASRQAVPQTNGRPEDHEPAPQSDAPRPKPHGESYHVLLVEDNILNQRILAKQLKTANCTVTIANHGEEALEVLKKTSCWRRQGNETSENCITVDVILMDWEMPIMDGLTCAKRIRELEREGRLTRRLPIIAITANVREEQIHIALAAGMDNVMPKPFTVSKLLARIGESVEKNAADSSLPDRSRPP